jgi:hypothetical protein
MNHFRRHVKPAVPFEKTALGCPHRSCHGSSRRFEIFPAALAASLA